MRLRAKSVVPKRSIERQKLQALKSQSSTKKASQDGEQNEPRIPERRAKSPKKQVEELKKMSLGAKKKRWQGAEKNEPKSLAGTLAKGSKTWANVPQFHADVTYDP